MGKSQEKSHRNKSKESQKKAEQSQNKAKKINRQRSTVHTPIKQRNI